MTVRIHFPNLTRPKKAAKFLCAAVADVRLNECQRAVALACGYADWHELERGHADRPASPLDEELALTDYAVRMNAQRVAFADVLGLYDQDAQWLAERCRLSGERPAGAIEREAVDAVRRGRHPRPDAAGRRRIMSEADLAEECRVEVPEWRSAFRLRWAGAVGRTEDWHAFPQDAWPHLAETIADWVPDDVVPAHAFWRHNGPDARNVGIAVVFARPDATGRMRTSLKHLANVPRASLAWTADPEAPIQRVRDTLLHRRHDPELRERIRAAKEAF